MTNAVKSLAALAQESRLAVFRLLVETGSESMQAGEISEELNIPASTLSFHLKDLSQAGLLKSERHGRAILYRANFSAMNDLIQFLLKNCCKRSNGKSCC